jgi:small subunit ribosomal protein S17
MRRRVTGKVVSSKMTKTIIVVAEQFKKHPLYKKYIKQRTKYYVDDKKELAKRGDPVLIEETRPLSKLKRWRLVKILETDKKNS